MWERGGGKEVSHSKDFIINSKIEKEITAQSSSLDNVGAEMRCNDGDRGCNCHVLETEEAEGEGVEGGVDAGMAGRQLRVHHHRGLYVGIVRAHQRRLEVDAVVHRVVRRRLPRVARLVGDVARKHQLRDSARFSRM